MEIIGLEKILEGQPKFRLKQCYQTIFTDLIEDWKDNTTLPPSLRERLEREYLLGLKAAVFGSKRSESVKILLELRDGEKVEAVLLKA